ncbi:hypothetical protein DRF57_17135, partial [Chryseobacterium rhizosphaerae]
MIIKKNDIFNHLKNTLMTKKLILRLALLAVTVFSVYSCRIEDDVTQNTKEPQNKFAAFTQQGNEKVNF